MFGSVPKTGLSSSLLPKVILRKMESEEALSQQTRARDGNPIG